MQAEDTVQVDWDSTLRDVPKTIILTQVTTHATEHRKQVKAILTQLGIEPPDLQICFSSILTSKMRDQACIRGPLRHSLKPHPNR